MRTRRKWSTGFLRNLQLWMVAAVVLGLATSLSLITGNNRSLLAVIPAFVVAFASLVAQELVKQRPKRRLWNSDRSPYPGLEPFTPLDSAVFFGRSLQIEEIVDRMNPAAGAYAHRFITVVGPSGSGKSSLVQGGVMATLGQRGRWLVVPAFQPGTEPVAALAHALAELPPVGNADGIEALLRADGHRALERRLRMVAGQRRQVIVIDQFEELYTLSGPGEAEELLDLVRETLHLVPKLWVIATIRSEFLTDLLNSRFAHLAHNPVTVGVLDTEALGQVIEGPAELAGKVFEPGLVSRMLTETGGGDALPLLAYLLHQLFDATRGRSTITKEDYLSLGGVRGAISRRAERVLQELAGSHGEDEVLRTLLKFVTWEGPEPTRRRVRRADLTGAEAQIADVFVNVRLVTSRTDDEGPVLDVAHEALFRYWAPLKQQVETHADELRRRTQLERWATEWVRSGRQRAFLLRGERLETAMRWSEHGDAVPEIEEFLAASRNDDLAWRERLSDSLAAQSTLTVDHDPELAILLAIAAIEECAVRVAAVRALHRALWTSRQRILLRGHDDWVWGIAWSPDGTMLASASHDHTVRLWDLAEPGESRVLRGHTDRVSKVRWSPDGTQLVSAAQDQTARVWNIVDGTELFVLTGHTHRLEAAHWRADGELIATASRDGQVRLWTASDGSTAGVLTGHEDWVQDVEFAPVPATSVPEGDGGRWPVASASGDGLIRIWGVPPRDDRDAPRQDGAPTLLRGHRGWVEAVAWSPDATALASASRDTTVRVWDIARAEQRLLMRGHESNVESLAWSPDGSRLASCSRDSTVRMWTADEGEEQAVLRGHGDWVEDVAWSPDSSRIASASRDGTIRIWDAAATPELVRLSGHTGWVRTGAWSPDGRTIATGSRDGTARLWNAATGEQIALLVHDDEVRSVTFSPDGLLVATASYDNTVRLWTSAGDEVHRLIGHREGVRRVRFSPTGDRLATCGREDTIRVWSAAGEQLAVLRGHRAMVRALVWSPDCTRLLTGSNDGTARIWSADGAELAVITTHTNSVTGVAWSPDGTTIATGSRDRRLLLWDPSTQELIRDLGHQEEVVRDLAWAPGDDRLAVGLDDGTARVWDTVQAVEIAILRGHGAWTEGVAWSPDATALVTTSGDGTARIWTVPPSLDSLLAIARTRVFRTLTPGERHSHLLTAQPA
ncbi:AAA family ATPase [Nocardia sp. GCM10030253]|uniref:nSTAND1 domain-containing NTPase n=1 Tax=Nocardia sp. GCM10030253 TaxID=3273404 RepID=UPI00363BF5BA